MNTTNARVHESTTTGFFGIATNATDSTQKTNFFDTFLDLLLDRLNMAQSGGNSMWSY